MDFIVYKLGFLTQIQYPLIFPVYPSQQELNLGNEIVFIPQCSDNKELQFQLSRLNIQAGTIVTSRNDLNVNGFTVVNSSSIAQNNSVKLTQQSYFTIKKIGEDVQQQQTTFNFIGTQNMKGLGLTYTALQVNLRQPIQIPSIIIRRIADKAITPNLNNNLVDLRNLSKLAIHSFEESKDQVLREFYHQYMDLNIEESEYTLKIIVLVLVATVNSFKKFKDELLQNMETEQDKSLFTQIWDKLFGEKPKEGFTLEKMEGLKELNFENNSQFVPKEVIQCVNIKPVEKIPEYEVYHQPTKADKIETAIILSKEDVEKGLGGISKIEYKYNKYLPAKKLDVDQFSKIIKDMPSKNEGFSNRVLGPIVNNCYKTTGEVKSARAMCNTIVNRLLQPRIEPVKLYQNFLSKIKFKAELVEQMSLKQIVNGYKGSKKARYEAAYKEYQENPFKIYQLMDQGGDIYRKCFIKNEQLYKCNNGQIEEFSSRCISGVANYAISLLQQSFIKNTNLLVKDAFEQIGVCYASGYDAVQIGQMMHIAFLLGQPEQYRFFYELDFSSFDSSQTGQHYRIEQQWYEQMFQIYQKSNDEFLNDGIDVYQKIKDTLIKQKDSILLFELDKWSSLRVHQKYGRKSGDPNTSLGNTIINAVTYNNIFNREDNSMAFMLGDDNLFASNIDYDENWIIEQYKQYGLQVKVIKREGPYLSKFLQCYLCPAVVDSQETHVLYRTPGRAMLQMQNCPMEFETNADKFNYIDLQIKGNPILLSMFPSLKYYYERVQSLYIDDGVQTKKAVNKLKELIELNEQKVHTSIGKHSVELNEQSFDVLKKIYGLNCYDPIVYKKEVDDAIINFKNGQIYNNFSCFDSFLPTI